MRHHRAPLAPHGLALAVLLLCPPVLSAQSGAECDTDECRRLAEEVADASRRIQEGKAGFANALHLFLASTAGTYGDEGPLLRRHLNSAALALAQWDGAIRTYTRLLGPVTGNADVHVALGSVHLDRGNVTRALDELSVAGRLASWRPDVFTLQGLAHQAAGRTPDAATAFARAAALAPDSALALYSVARQHQRLGNDVAHLDALEHFARQHAGSRPPGSPLPFARVALFREVANLPPMLAPAPYVPGLLLLARGRYEDALATFRRAIDGDPLPGTIGAIPPEIAAGSAALRAGGIGEAIGHFEVAVKETPDSAEARRLLGAALLADEQYEAAMEQLERSVSLNPQDERPRLVLAEALAASGRTADAEQLLRRCIEQLTDSVRVHLALGRLLQADGRAREAIQHLGTVAESRPLVGLDYLYDQIGSLYLAEADLDGAVDAFWRRVDVNPNSADAHRRLGLAYLQQARQSEALAEFVATLLIDPESVDAHAGRAQILLQRGDYAGAEEAARRALALDPTHMAARYARGAALLRLDRTEEGTNEIEVFERLQTDARARDERRWQLAHLKQAAWTRADEGAFDEAAALLTDALALEPDDPVSYLGLGVVLRKANRDEEAATALERALALGAGPEVHSQLAEVYDALGRADDSRRHQRSAERVKADRIRRAGGAP
jgi:tetratricopeptide (TPR) repeat protein